MLHDILLALLGFTGHIICEVPLYPSTSSTTSTTSTSRPSSSTSIHSSSSIYSSKTTASNKQSDREKQLEEDDEKKYSNIMTTFRVKDGYSQINDGDREIINRLAPLGWYFLRFQDYVKKYDITIQASNKNVQLYRAALCSSLEELLEEYVEEVNELELCVNREAVPLSFLFQKLQNYLIIFPQLFEMLVIVEQRAYKGCQILNFFSSHVSGIPIITQTISRIVFYLRVVFLKQIYSWILYGELDDDSGEFFIACTEEEDEKESNFQSLLLSLQEEEEENETDYTRKMNKNEVNDLFYEEKLFIYIKKIKQKIENSIQNSSKLNDKDSIKFDWGSTYILRLEQIPDAYCSPLLASRILFIGKVIKLLKLSLNTSDYFNFSDEIFLSFQDYIVEDFKKMNKNDIDSEEEEEDKIDEEDLDEVEDTIAFNFQQTKISSLLNNKLVNDNSYDSYFIGAKFYYLKFYYSFLNDKNYEKIYKIFLKNYQKKKRLPKKYLSNCNNNENYMKKKSLNSFILKNLSFLISKNVLKTNNQYFNVLINMKLNFFNENFEIFLLNYYNNFSLTLWYIIRENFQFFNFLILLKNFFLLYNGEFFSQLYSLIFHYLYSNNNNEKFFINFLNNEEKNKTSNEINRDVDDDEEDEFDEDPFLHSNENNAQIYYNNQKYSSSTYFKRYQSKLYYKNNNNFFTEFNQKIENFQLNSNKIYNNLLNFFILPSILTSNNPIFFSSSSSSLPSLIHFYFENNFFYNENFKNFNFLALKMNGYYDYSFNSINSSDNNEEDYNNNVSENPNSNSKDNDDQEDDDLLNNFNNINDEIFLLNNFNANLYPDGIILNNFNNKNIQKYFQILNYYLRFHFTSILRQNNKKSEEGEKIKCNKLLNFWNSFTSSLNTSSLSTNPSIYTKNFYLNSSLWWKNEINFLHGFKKNFSFNFLWIKKLSNIISCLDYFNQNKFKKKFFLNIPTYKNKTFVHNLKSSNISEVSSVLSSLFCCLHNDKKGIHSNCSGDLSRGISNSLLFGASFHVGFVESISSSPSPVFYARLFVARGATEGMTTFPQEQPIKFVNNFTSSNSSFNSNSSFSSPLKNHYESFLHEDKSSNPYDFILSEKFVDLNIKPGKSLGKYNLIVDYNKTIHYASNSLGTGTSSPSKGEIQYIIKVRLEEVKEDNNNEPSNILQSWTLDYFFDLSTFLQDTAFIGVTSSSLILPNIEEKEIKKNTNDNQIETKIKILTKLPYVLNFQLSNINLVLKNNTENLVLICSPYLINNYNKLYKILYYENKKLENFLNLKLNISNYSLIFSILFDNNSMKIYQKLFGFLYRINLIKFLFSKIWYNNNKFLMKKFYNKNLSKSYTYSTYSTSFSNDNLPNFISFEFYYKKLYKLYFLMNYFLNSFISYLQIDVVDSNFNEFFQNILTFSGPSNNEVFKHFEYYFLNNIKDKENSKENLFDSTDNKNNQFNYKDIEEDNIKNTIEEVFQIINSNFKVSENSKEKNDNCNLNDNFSTSFFSSSSEGIQGVRKSHIKFQTSLLRLCHLDQNNTLKSVEKLLLLIARFITLFKLFVELEYEKEEKRLYYEKMLKRLNSNSSHLSEETREEIENRILDEMNNDNQIEDEISVPIEEFEWIRKEFLLNLNFLRNYLLTNIDYTSSFLLRLDFNNFFSKNENNL